LTGRARKEILPGPPRGGEKTLACLIDSDPVAHAPLIKAAGGNPRANPLVIVASRAAADILCVGGKFDGLGEIVALAQPAI
jgi:hypothetical protein